MKNIIKSFLLLAFFCWFPSTVCVAEVTYYHTDAMGTPMAMTDSTGKVVWQGDFYPFGEEYQIQATPNKNKRRFTGKEKDEESGLHYFGARYMDEASGRFVSPDPVTAVDAQTSETNTALLANPLRLNRYVYGLNNPHRYIDPDGNFAKDIENGINPYEILESGGSGRGVGGGGYTGGEFRFRDFFKSGKAKGKSTEATLNSGNAGRAGKQGRLRELAQDPKVSSSDRGWIKQDVNQIQRGKRKNIRVPPGKNLAHRRGFEAKKGYGYNHSDLQNVDLHKLQHKHEGY